ncbi:LiaF transmembrane domain-containing protein [Paenibacillus thalictri]|uniref:LiaF transmembrane domain-containing protein n=1 Tax=Paenibacillus thalictri TaxID=2527873 RepID=A0A4Q9DLI2_9BACL|nr:hypothetical protein [Paenibacillus thalictri]TBL72933.1 hypothetical protein EYB31_27255 [Paenibacillus thalictri]
MKKWRVGTLSMGLTLVLLGALLFASQWEGLQAFDALAVWWPVILILLGLEIIGYLIFSRKENQVIYYDILSIFFVGVLCLGSLGFAFLTSLGVVSEVRSALHTVERSGDLPAISQEIPQTVKRIIVQTSGEAVKIDKSEQPALNVFGTYRIQTALSETEGTAAPANSDDYCTVRTVGDTMYVQLKPLPAERGWKSSYRHMEVTAVLPQDKQVELRGYNGQIIKP